MNEENKYIEEQQEESSIDYGKLFRDLLKHKKLFYKVLPITFVVAAIISLSIPSYYKCEVILSPELSSRRSSGSLSSLASTFGINISGAMGNATEALFPTLYPDLMNSVDFKTSLFPVLVTIEGDKKAGEPDRTMTYYEYLENEQKKPWWSYILSLPSMLVKAVVGDEEAEEEAEAEAKKKPLDPFRLTKKQARIVKSLKNKIVCDVDKKTMVITIDVTDQNALICATMADSVQNRLQKFITDYRTNKARVDLEHNQKICAEARVRYEQARDRYARFSDANRDVISQNTQTKKADLHNEMQLQQSIYQQAAAQVQQAAARVQEETPAFTTLQSATVPVKRAGPRRTRICLIFLFLAFVGTSAWIFYKEDDLKPLLGLS